MKAYQPSREERAFLFQEAQDLEPLVKDLGSLSVIVEEVKSLEAKNPQARYRVTFLVAPESFAMKVHATDKNIYEATIAAKAETQRQLNVLVNSLPKDWNAGATGVKIPSELLH